MASVPLRIGTFGVRTSACPSQRSSQNQAPRPAAFISIRGYDSPSFRWIVPAPARRRVKGLRLRRRAHLGERADARGAPLTRRLRSRRTNPPAKRWATAKACPLFRTFAAERLRIVQSGKDKKDLLGAAG